MRSHADARGGAKVHQNFAARQLSGHFQAVGDVERHHAAALLRIATGVDTLAVFIGQRQQSRGLPLGLLADRGHADLVDDLVAGARRVERRNVGRAVEETEGVIGVADRSAGEGEGLLVRHPAGGRGLQRGPQVAAHVEVSGAGSAAEPLHRTAGSEVQIQGADVHRHGAGRLV